jgi:hypothetical protein
MPHALHETLHALGRLGWAWGIAISVTAAVVSLLLAGAVVVNWPTDQFKHAAPPLFMAGRHPVLRVLGIAGKNVIGLLLILMGIVMSLPGVPGQGFLTILIGLTLVDFPGKRRLEQRLIRRPSVLRVVNRVRARFGHPALEFD